MPSVQGNQQAGTGDVTPEMVEAGGVALIKSKILSDPTVDIDDAVMAVFAAMKAAAKRHPRL